MPYRAALTSPVRPGRWRRRSWGWFRSRGRGDDWLRRRRLFVGTRREDPRGNHDGNHRRVTP